MPTSYTGRQTEEGEDDSPSGERATQRKPMQPMQAGQPAQAYIGRTFQPQPGPASTPGQQSPMPWTQAAGSGSTPWLQSLQGQDTRAFSMDPQKSQQIGSLNAANSAYQTMQANQQRAQQGFNQAANNAGISAQLNANNAAYAQQQARMNAANNAAMGGGGMQIGGGGPNWAALSQRFGGSPMGGGGIAAQFGGGMQQQGGGNPWLQQLLGGLAQRFSGLQRGQAPQGQAAPSARLWAGPGRR